MKMTQAIQKEKLQLGFPTPLPAGICSCAGGQILSFRGMTELRIVGPGTGEGQSNSAEIYGHFYRAEGSYPRGTQSSLLIFDQCFSIVLQVRARQV
jgi:hypothetical protein